MTDVIYIAGPTASGKSSYALDIARSRDGVLINADSMQVYEALRLLTARPDDDDMSKAPHKLYGHIKDPNEPYSVAKWRGAAVAEIEKALKQGKVPIVVGGTGLYAKALFNGLSPVPDIDPMVREKLRLTSLKPGGIEILYQDLLDKDPQSHAALEPGDTQRIVRALEVVLSSGKPLGYWQAQPVESLPYKVHKVLLNPERAAVVARAEKRLHQMFEGGAIQEVEHLLALGIKDDSPLYKAVGVREIKAYLEGALTREEAFERALIATRQYIKRQQTWFRHQMAFDEIIDV